MKKYSDKFISNVDILQCAKIGFEFEMYMNDMSYYKTLEMLNLELNPIQVWGFRQYHSKFNPDEVNFKLEPDLSLGSNGCELITGAMNYFEAKIMLVKILRIIDEYAYTTDKCAIHFNISFNEESQKNLNDLNILKLILNINEDEIYQFFPNRRDNVYTKSVKSLIPYKNYDYSSINISVLKNNMRIPTDKYYGINFTHINDDKEFQRLEYRYIGGKDYQKKVGNLIYFLDRFILDTYDSIGTDFSELDNDKIKKILDINIMKYKNFNSYDTFLYEYPTISLQIDQSSEYNTVSSYYSKIRSILYEVLKFNDLSECIINFVTTRNKIEIIDAKIKTNVNMKNIDFINCNIDNSMLDSCELVDCQIKNSQMNKCNLENVDAYNSKVLDCVTENSDLDDCYISGGFFNSTIKNGVIRSGMIGADAEISPDTKIVNSNDNFFNTDMNMEKKIETKEN